MTGKQIRERRHRLGLTQEELATALGVKGNTVARWERDEMRPSAMLRLAMNAITTKGAAKK